MLRRFRFSDFVCAQNNSISISKNFNIFTDASAQLSKRIKIICKLNSIKLRHMISLSSPEPINSAGVDNKNCQV